MQIVGSLQCLQEHDNGPHPQAVVNTPVSLKLSSGYILVSCPERLSLQEFSSHHVLSV
jgi:hypothetical protein